MHTHGSDVIYQNTVFKAKNASSCKIWQELRPINPPHLVLRNEEKWRVS